MLATTLYRTLHGTTVSMYCGHPQKHSCWLHRYINAYNVRLTSHSLPSERAEVVNGPQNVQRRHMLLRRSALCVYCSTCRGLVAGVCCLHNFVPPIPSDVLDRNRLRSHTFCALTLAGSMLCLYLLAIYTSTKPATYLIDGTRE